MTLVFLAPSGKQMPKCAFLVTTSAPVYRNPLSSKAESSDH